MISSNYSRHEQVQRISKFISKRYETQYSLKNKELFMYGLKGFVYDSVRRQRRNYKGRTII